MWGSSITVQYLRPSVTNGEQIVATRIAVRYVTLLVVLPPLVLLPLAITFLFAVTHLAHALEIGGLAILGYGAGAAVLGRLLLRRARRVEEATSAQAASSAISECLDGTVIGASALWLGWGALLAFIGAAFVAPSLSGFENFGEAALLIAAPAMAWSYWGGKAMLLSSSPYRGELEYSGRVYSVGVKIALVFIGFFVVSMGALIQLISAKIVERLHGAGVAAEEVAADVTRYGVLIVLATAIIFAVATYFLARDIIGPLKRSIRQAGEMADGRFDTATYVFSDDEVGSLAKSFGATHRSLRSLLGQVGQSGATITGYAEAMSAGTAKLTEGAHKQRRIASESTGAANSVRDEARSVLEAVEKVGDLSYESASSAVELNASSAEVAKRMDELFQSVEKTTSSTTEIDATARETSARATDLASVGNDVLVFVTQMDATIEEINRTSTATSELSRQVRANAEAGSNAVDATVAGVRAAQESTRRTAGAFEALQKSLGEIDKILVFINELTDRTNLLSLNAAIIAAQAGQNDFGFSVIADEVRQLADRTRAATKDIAAIIRKVQPITREATNAIEEGVASVDRTVALAQGATASLATILTSADRSLEMVQTISVSLSEQSKASRHLHQVTTRVSDTISEMQRATVAQAEGTRLLAEESERVRAIALQVKRSTAEQQASGAGIATAMEGVSADIRTVRNRLQNQVAQAEHIASAAATLLAIASQNDEVAGDFTQELRALLESGKAFAAEVAKFKL